MPTQLVLLSDTGTAGDDFIVRFGDAQTVEAGDGDDLVMGDISGQYITGTTTSMASPGNIDVSQAWYTEENPFIEDASIPHTSLYVHPEAGQNEYASVTVGAGETITVDVDFVTQIPDASAAHCGGRPVLSLLTGRYASRTTTGRQVGR